MFIKVVKNAYNGQLLHKCINHQETQTLSVPLTLSRCPNLVVTSNAPAAKIQLLITPLNLLISYTYYSDLFHVAINELHCIKTLSLDKKP